ncbi:DUF2828 family protein [Butyrivibrio sp. X503]|uniref:DUF2828 family protein n=1 Tax=Butyrivibrio sp. X503 TaxID=2364878 RepID=UPI000EA9E17D|nr:DUF2828 family protein [Butyrivibrio sp. X503]RKM55261.1 DUF2828 family protein [Butyrivibrio sp. X503]
MLEFLKREANKTHTENGAATYVSTQSDCLDLFATIGALRNASDDEIINRFMKAYAENAELAMKMLFFARDIRGGLGERRVFKVILKYLAVCEPESVKKNIENVAEYGRFDDLLALMNTSVEKEVTDYLEKILRADMQTVLVDGENANISLLAKWLPSINASNKETVRNAKKIAKAMNMTEKEYRKVLAMLRAQIKIIENKLREKDYSFDYKNQASKALYKYRQAFIRNDGERYRAFIEEVKNKPGVMNTGTLTPYDVILPAIKRAEFSEDERNAMDATWNALENFAGSEDSLVVVDGSGSMYWDYNITTLPAAVAQSLGIYFAERNKGKFHNHFITFSTNPRLVEIKGEDIVEKVRYCMSFNECGNTNIEKTFMLILNTAVRNRLKQKDMPKKLFIISDMEFDSCARDSSMTNFENAKAAFAKRGYKLPQIVFWNVNSRNRQQPVRVNDQGVALVSGCNPQIFSMLKDGNFEPYKFMMSVLSTKRYERIAA